MFSEDQLLISQVMWNMADVAYTKYLLKLKFTVVYDDRAYKDYQL